MKRRIKASFTTRRDAEMAVEHLVQELKVAPESISIISGSEENTSGTQPSGSDIEPGSGEPRLAGTIVVSVDDEMGHDYAMSLAAHGGNVLPSGQSS